MLLGFHTGIFRKFIKPISKEVLLECLEIGCQAIELGCARKERISQLEKLNKKDIEEFKYISLHMPTDVIYNKDKETKDLLNRIEKVQQELNFNCIVIHPDLVKDWNIFNNGACIEQ